MNQVRMALIPHVSKNRIWS